MDHDIPVHLSHLLFAKCTCEAAVTALEAILVERVQKPLSKDEEKRAMELQAQIAAAYKRLGALIGRDGLFSSDRSTTLTSDETGGR